MKGKYPVIVVGFRDALLLDIAGPVQVYSTANKLLGTPYYEVHLVSEDGGPVETDAGLVMLASSALAKAPAGGDLIIPGGAGVDQLLQNETFLTKLQRATKTRARIVSVCSGALLLAATGLLDGRTATSHWARTTQMQQLYPKVNWQPDAIFVCDDPFYTSAGITAGIDLALSLIETDHGSDLALRVAHELVVYLRRSGGQGQYSKLLTLQHGLSQNLRRASEAVLEDPASDWRVAKLADVAGMTQRNLSRRFMKEAGVSPAKYVETIRLDLARTLLVTSPLSIDQIALKSGFQNSQNLRRVFHQKMNVTPSQYRQRFGGSS